MITLEMQLDIAHKLLADTEARSLRNRGDSSHPAHTDVETAKAIVGTIERAVGCRDCANSDWPKETIAK